MFGGVFAHLMPLNYENPQAQQILDSLNTNGYTQEGVNQLYQVLGLGTAPIVPQNLIGGRPGSGRDMLSIYGSDGKRIGGRTGEIGSFLNTFNSQAVDPYRTPSTISNIAGGVLNAVGTAVGGPVWGMFSAGAEAGNRGLNPNATNTSSGFGQYGAIGGLLGGAYNALGLPGSYNAGQTSSDPNRGITESGAMGGTGEGMSGASGWDWGRLLDYGVPLLGGFLESQGSKDASRASERASAAAIAEQRRQYDQTRQDMQPWLTAGTGALNRLQDPNAFTASPSYNWIKNESFRDIGNQFSASGGAKSGNALRALQDRGANLASMEYNNWFNQQSNLAGLGQTSAQNLGSFGANSAGNIGNLLQGQGNARASGIEGSTNAYTNLLQQLMATYNRRNPS